MPCKHHGQSFLATPDRAGKGDDLAGLFTYAILATVLAIVVLSMLGKAAAKVGGEAAFEREAEG